MKSTAIVLAGGRGKRMNSAVPKQYIEVEGKTLLHYTLTAFEQSDIDDIVVVCGAGDETYVRENIIMPGNITKVRAVVAGGKERYNSVYNGLLACPDTDIVLVHDGARCLIKPELINRCIEKLLAVDACIVAVPVKDTIKQVEGDVVASTPKRSTLVSVQTPQGFKYSALMHANQVMNERIAAGEDEKALGITDDAMIMETFSDVPVHVIMGDEMNIKVTTPEDLNLVKMALATK